MTAPRDTPSLALPFALVGLAAGFVAQAVARKYMPADGPHMTLVLPGINVGVGVAALILGRWASRRVASMSATWVVIPIMTSVTGAIVGCITAAALHAMSDEWAEQPAVWWLQGLIIGAVTAMPAAPAFTIVAYAGRRVGTARAGSLIDGAHRRGVWGAATLASAVTMTVAFVVLRGQIEDGTAFVVAASSSLVLAIAFFFNVDALVKLVRKRAPRATRASVAPLVVDYGIGDEVEERDAETAAAYRESARRVIVFRGTRRRAIRSLVVTTVASAAAFALVFGSAIAAFLR